MHSYRKVTVFLDIEGSPNWPYEIGAIATKHGKIESAFIGWCPPQIDEKSLNLLNSSARYCHGLRLSWLKNEGESHESLIARFYCWLQSIKPRQIAANSIEDITLFIQQLGLTIPIIDVSLPNWRDRHRLDEHQDSYEAKRSEIPMPNGLNCPYKSAHCPTIRVTSKSGETQAARRAHGSHCALYDAFEIALFALNRNLI